MISPRRTDSYLKSGLSALVAAFAAIVTTPAFAFAPTAVKV